MTGYLLKLITFPIILLLFIISEIFSCFFITFNKLCQVLTVIWFFCSFFLIFMVNIYFHVLNSQLFVPILDFYISLKLQSCRIHHPVSSRVQPWAQFRMFCDIRNNRRKRRSISSGSVCSGLQILIPSVGSRSLLFCLFSSWGGTLATSPGPCIPPNAASWPCLDHRTTTEQLNSPFSDPSSGSDPTSWLNYTRL